MLSLGLIIAVSGAYRSIGHHWDYYFSTLYFVWNHSISTEDRVSIDEIYRHSIFKWVAATEWYNRVSHTPDCFEGVRIMLQGRFKFGNEYS